MRSWQSSEWRLRYLGSLDFTLAVFHFLNNVQFVKFDYFEVRIYVFFFFFKASRDEANSVHDQLHEAEQEVKSLRITTQRMILTHEEMVSTG